MKMMTLEQRVAAVLKSTAAAIGEIHAVAVDCLIHAQEHGDFGPLARLRYGLHSTMGRKVEAWAKTFAPVTFNGEKAVKRRGLDAPAFNIEGARAINPLDYKREKAEAYLSLETFNEKLNKLIKAAEKALDEDEVFEEDRDAIARRVEVIRNLNRRGWALPAREEEAPSRTPVAIAA